jgi:hypothetical protein
VKHATTSGTPRRNRAGAVAAVAAVALALGACSPREAGAAAVYGDERITTDQVTQAVQGIKQGNPEIAQTPGLEQTVLFYLLVAPFLLPAAERAGAGVSDSEAASQLLPKATNPDPQALRVLRTFLALQKLQQGGATPVLQQVQRQIQTAGVRVNPRFGRLDTSRLEIVQRQPNWLVRTPAPTATETPPPAAP